MKKMPGISNKKRAEVQEHLTRLLSYEQPKTIKICQQWEALIKSNQLSDDDPLYSPLVFVLARFYGMQHKLDKSLYYIDMAERMAIKYGNHLAEFKAKSNRAIILVEQQNYFEAIKVWTELLKDVSDPLLLANIHQNLGMAHLQCDHHDKCLEHLYKAVDVLQRNHLDDALADAYNNLANEYRELGNTFKSREYYLLALELYQKTANQHRIAMIYNNLCLSFVDQKDFSQATEYGLLAQEYIKKYCPALELAHVLSNLGLIQLHTGKFGEAEEYFVRALEIAREYQDDRLQIIQLNNLAHHRYTVADYPQCILFAKRALKKIGKDVLSSHADTSYGFLHTAHLALKQYKKAYQALLKKHEISLQRLSENPKIIMARAEADFLKLKVEAQAQSYQVQNAQLNESNQIISEKTQALILSHQELETRNALLNRLISIIAHDVRGPLTSIATALGMIQNNDFDPSDQDELIKEMRQSADLTSELLDDLLLLIRNYATQQSELITEINLTELVNEVIAICKTTARHKQIHLSFIGEDNLPKLKNNPDQIKVILRNLLGNALKFTASGGEVIVTLEQTDTSQIMSIRDTGVGMTQQTIENILSGTENSTLGTANEKGFGLGLKFAIEFIELTQGKLEIESTPGKGSLFRLSYQK